ncbi:hypothetical protein N836_24380 [Leptolyngbya sp. Heron Island J]|uniref:hypothetical protein n=1 Tax=Leptolyngbya sp. Heron Island J TaxID=1385935 RepID=UPI0003B965AE|nr:hypothetical protein [Leptolyngbya sp. Heron Island J]ESA32751.1 hypothetical protein N836_24380 [Leptolyngbya sp. Heron Island J]
MSDALSRLKNRQRPKVSPRNNQVVQKSPDIQSQRHTESEDSVRSIPEVSVDISNPGHIDASNPSADTLISRHIESETSLKDLEVKRSTFRLEVGLINRLHQHCKESGISREVLIESMFEYIEANPGAMAQVMAKAEEKNAYRQQLANRKRAQAMMDKFG